MCESNCDVNTEYLGHGDGTFCTKKGENIGKN